MKPVNLKIKGLNSFVQQQTIEFSKLTEKGLFGIFGPTASGKSTILDGITIALYGKVSRDTKEFVNTETNVVEISFDFEIGLGETRKLYRAERSIKRLKTGNFKTAYARLIEINKENADENKVLAEGPKDIDTKIIEIIGLKVEDFTRSVVLPQGKFNEFLKLTGKERRNMLERIFALEKYGTKLYEKIRSVRNENLKTQTMIQGEMKGYEDVGEEGHNEIKSVLDGLKQEEKQIKADKKTVDKEYEEYKTIWELQQEKSQYVKKEADLNKQVPEIKNKKEKFTRGSSALNVKPYIDNVYETKKRLAINKDTLQKLSSAFLVVCQKLNITKTSYDKAWTDKNNKLPILIEKEVSLKQATNIEEKISYLAGEKDILLKQHKEIRSNISEKNLKSAIIVTNKSKIENQLGVTEEKLSGIEIPPEYREKLYNAYNSELEVSAATKNVQELKKKGEDLKKGAHTTKLMHREAIILKESKQNKLVLLEEKSKKIANNFPGDNNLLLEKQEAYSSLRDTLEKAVENHKIKGELQGKYRNINIETEKGRLNLKNAEESIESVKAQLKIIEGEIKEIEQANMAAVLASSLKEGDELGKPRLCPVCGSEHHPKVAELIVNTGLETKKSLKQSGELNLENLSKDYQKEQIKLVRLISDEEYINSQLEIVNVKLHDINIEELRREKDARESSLIQFKENLEVYNKQKTEIDLELNKLRDEKSKVDMEEVKLGEGLRKENEALIVIDEELSIAEGRLKLLREKHELLKVDLLNQESSFKQNQSGSITSVSIKEKIQQLKDIDNEVIKLTAMARKLRVELVTLEKEASDVDKCLRDLTTSKTEIETSGKEKKAEIDRLTIQIVELCGFTPEMDRTPKIEIEKVKNEIKDITSIEASLKDILEKENIEKQRLDTQKTSEENKSEMLLKMLEDGEKKLDIALKENSFENAEIACLYLISRGDLLLIEKEIKQYEESKRSIIDNLQRVENLLNGKEIDATLFEEVKEKREVLGKILEEKTKAIGAQYRALEEMERKLLEVKNLIIKRSAIEHKLSLLREIDTLIQGNKFVEYVAMKQLKYISMEASKRLKDITRGRYALELDSDGAFVMRDDFNGGTRRETNTLSGGETFLTSLCLALALSSQIQLKGSAPLEFFFLDEGFGTLDTNLLEVVMNSLEKLHSSTLSVGIISHVEELRSRVPVKLIVTPSEHGQGGSKVKLEYT
ncbi:AAA family ATPase [Clostridium sp. CF011]|uniref:SbcC/MukB-like Walker B domain-containing protein n=1 Tax=Clostridium sp. CF011 TaxID=2843318 RepID=UPI001C0DFF9D|nr:AAA family ATPase [Clostridium sp. CF011]MBU3091453.1 AAA family ATPase [Clostridium sp. CF011]WAG69262.1 AAA family ATPase [Clostridium sp. CF011]